MVVPKIITQPILRPHSVTQPILQQQLIQQPIVETRQVIQPVIRRIITQPVRTTQRAHAERRAEFDSAGHPPLLSADVPALCCARSIFPQIIRPQIYESTTIQPTLKTETTVQPHIVQQTVVTPTLMNQVRRRHTENGRRGKATGVPVSSAKRVPLNSFGLSVCVSLCLLPPRRCLRVF